MEAAIRIQQYLKEVGELKLKISEVYGWETKKQELDQSSNNMIKNNKDTIMIPYSDNKDTINKGKQKEVVEEDNDFNKELSQVI